jgi:D-serine deaminase-like pyridoxal phosphate-dependent protein
MKISDLHTPTLVLDREKVINNAGRMTARMASAGVRLRPHMKTAKSIDVARHVLDGNFGGVTVSTLKEAAYFLGHQVTDIVYAVCIEPSKLDHAADLAAHGADLKVITDNVDVVRAIAAHGGRFRVLIEIDCGEHRTGIVPDHPGVLEIAELLARSKNAELAGVMTHAGHSYGCRSETEIKQVARDEREAVVGAAKRIRDAGFNCEIVSVGSTPTATFGESFEGVTEARPGVFVFYDLFQAGLGVCSTDDIALSVLTSVISIRPEENCILIDAGGLALSKDRSTAALNTDFGFGLVCDGDTGVPIDGLTVDGVHQEHGQITLPDASWLKRFSVGTRLRILPNHSCMTAAAYDAYQVIDGEGVIAEWSRCNGW